MSPQFRSRTVQLVSIAVAMIGCGSAPAQTWIGPGTDWNTAANWFPATVPNTSSATAVFSGTGLGSVNISASVLTQELFFNNATGNYTLTSSTNQTLSGVKAVLVGSGVTSGTRTINLANVATGSLLIAASADLTIENDSTSTNTTVVIGPNTVIGAASAGTDVKVTGSGTTQFSGSFAGGSNQVASLGNLGQGKLIFSGSGANLGTGLAVVGGTLELNYATNTATKTSGALNLTRGVLSLVANTLTPVTQSITATFVTGSGHTDVVASSAGGGTLTLALGAIFRTGGAGGTIDMTTGSGVPNFTVTTTTYNHNGLLGVGPAAFATFAGGTTWATASGAGPVFTVAGLPDGSYSPNNYSAAANNVDMTASASPAAFTVNSLRFTNPSLTLALTGTNVLQSGGILAGTGASGGDAITGGTLTAPGGGELLIHLYGGGSNFTINSSISAAGGLTKTGNVGSTLTLGGSNPSLTGAININRGNLTVTTTDAVAAASGINFNDARIGGPLFALQTFTVDLGNNNSGTITPPINVSAFHTGTLATAFSTGASTGSRVTLSGVLRSSPSAATTPISFTGPINDSSGFNLTNANNSFTGDITLLNGSLGISGDGCLGNAANKLILNNVSTTAGGLEFLANGITLPTTRSIVFGSSGRIVVNGNDEAFINGTVSSTGSGSAFQFVKAGTGLLLFGGNGSGHLGGLTLSGGTLELDYRTNTASKLGGGALTLNGGTLFLDVNTTTPVTQTIPGGTAVAAGHTDIRAASTASGSLTLGLGAVSRSLAGTFDVSLNGGTPTFTVTTSTTNTNGLLGTGPAFATVNGYTGATTWATASGGSIVGLSTYGSTFTSNTNVDITTSSTQNGFTANSLRFSAPNLTLTLTGTNTLQSGGILFTPVFASAAITGGTLTAPGGGELLIHDYNGSFPVALNAALVSSSGLTVTGSGNLQLTLGGNNSGLTGPININRGSLTITTTAAVNSASQINFNDIVASVGYPEFKVDLGNGLNGTINPNIRVSSDSTTDFGTSFTTGASTNSRITLAGVISSATNQNTSVRFLGIGAGAAVNSSGFNLTGSSTFTGNIALKFGFLGINSDASLGNVANMLTLDVNDVTNGGLEFLTGNITMARPVFISRPTRIICNGTDSNTISSAIDTSFGIYKDGTGTLTLPNAQNSISGDITVAAGTLSFGQVGGSGFAPSVTVGSGAVFQPATSLDRNFATLTLNGGTFRVSSGTGHSHTFNQIATDSSGGAVDFTGAGSDQLLVLKDIAVNGNSTWLSPGNGTIIRSLASGFGVSKIIVPPGVTFTNGIALQTLFYVTGGGTLFQNCDATNAAGMTANLRIDNSRFRIIDASSNGGVGNFGTGTFLLNGGTFAYGGTTATTIHDITLLDTGGKIEIESASAALTVNGAITGTGPLTKIGPGTLILGNAATSISSLTITAGTVQTANDATLGPDPITFGGLGTLQYSGTPTTARTFNLNFGTLAAAAGATATLNGATIIGGFMRGPGTFVLTGGTTLAGVTTAGSTTINVTGPASFVNVTNGATLNVAPALAVPTLFSLFTNQGSGAITVGATSAVNANDFQSYGTLSINPATVTENFSQTTLVTNVGTSPLYFNGGSRTFVGTPATAVFPPSSPQAGLPTFVAGIDLNGKNAIVAGGLFVNNGYVEDSSNGFAGTATVIADFGSLVKGAGYFQNSVVTVNGGKFQAGNSPGMATFGKFVLGPGGVSSYVFAIDDATGVAGPTPDAAGHVSGWGVVKSISHLAGVESTTGDFVWTATPSDKITVTLQTLLNPTTVGTDVQGIMDHFDPTRPYAWSAVEWSGSYAGPADDATLDASTAFDTSRFANPIQGTFGWSLDSTDHMLSLTYTPLAVPEPGSLVLLAAAVSGIAVYRRWRS
jgi:autotransporter-associated beta strand protein